MRTRTRRSPAVAAVVVVAACAAGFAGAVVGAPAAGAAVDDPGRSRQWALDRIGVDAAWEVATGSGVTIAIVDSGVDLDHPDLRDKIIASTDCVAHDDAPGGCLDGGGQDDTGHGTHVAGIAAASTGNGQGVAGVAPAAGILAVRVLANSCRADGRDPAASSCDAEGTEADVAEGIRWAADHGADVINLSLGSVTQAVVGPGRTFADALDYAWSRGAIPVLVAGNDLLLPGSVVDVPAVVVSATDRRDGRTTYSNGVGNVRWAVAAPGGEADTAQSCEAAEPEGILSTYHRPAREGDGTSGYACVAGTSMAAPHVAGVLALLRSAGLDPEAAVQRLLDTAVDLGPTGRDGTFGAGRVDAARALAGLDPTGQPIAAADGTGAAPTDVGPSTTGVLPPATPGDDGSAGSPVAPGASTATTSPDGTTDAAPADLDGAGGDDGDEAAAPLPGPPVTTGDSDEVSALAVAAATAAVAAVGIGHLLVARRRQHPSTPGSRG